ncbi:hypothetical protein ACA910_008616 [Epithemia clementina (nom. ined.)]
MDDTILVMDGPSGAVVNSENSVQSQFESQLGLLGPKPNPNADATTNHHNNATNHNSLVLMMVCLASLCALYVYRRRQSAAANRFHGSRDQAFKTSRYHRVNQTGMGYSDRV